MLPMSRESIASLLYVASWVLVIVIALFARINVPALGAAAKLLGGLIFLCGMLLFGWAARYLKAGFLGNIEPVSDTLVAQGPYRLVRHPLYLGTLLSTIGLVVGLRSLWGLVTVFVFFLPAAIYRARLEERAVARKFGDDWDAYVSRTSFLFPWAW